MLRNGTVNNLQAPVDSGGVRVDTPPISNGSPHDSNASGAGSPGSFTVLYSGSQTFLIHGTLLHLLVFGGTPYIPFIQYR